MTRRRPLNDAETDAAINEWQDRAYTRDDEAALIARDEWRYEAHVYGDDYRDWYGDRGRTA